MTEQELQTPPTEEQIASVLAWLNDDATQDLRSVVRRQAFQRDRLQTELGRVKKQTEQAELEERMTALEAFTGIPISPRREEGS